MVCVCIYFYVFYGKNNSYKVKKYEEKGEIGQSRTNSLLKKR